MGCRKASDSKSHGAEYTMPRQLRERYYRLGRANLLLTTCACARRYAAKTIRISTITLIGNAELKMECMGRACYAAMG